MPLALLKQVYAFFCFFSSRVIYLSHIASNFRSFWGGDSLAVRLTQPHGYIISSVNKMQSCLKLELFSSKCNFLRNDSVYSSHLSVSLFTALETTRFLIFTLETAIFYWEEFTYLHRRFLRALVLRNPPGNKVSRIKRVYARLCIKQFLRFIFLNFLRSSYIVGLFI